MNYEDFYNISKKLHRLKDVARIASNTHLYRMSIMADGSKRGLDCGYAQASAKLFLLEEASFVDYIRDNMDIFSADFLAEVEALLDQSAAITPK